MELGNAWASKPTAGASEASREGRAALAAQPRAHPETVARKRGKLTAHRGCDTHTHTKKQHKTQNKYPQLPRLYFVVTFNAGEGVFHAAEILPPGNRFNAQKGGQTEWQPVGSNGR